MIQSFGWASVFYIFGSVGVFWFVMWLQKAASGPTNDPLVSAKEKAYIIANTCDQVCTTVKSWVASLPRLGARASISENGYFHRVSGYVMIVSSIKRARGLDF